MSATSFERTLVVLAAATLLLPQPAAAQDFPRGQLIERVTCADDETQSYALYLPSDYTPDRPWNLLLAFHPSARGQVFVEKYRVAAEHFGYIVAASNNSRNGSWDVTTKAVRAVSRDVGRRFAVDAQTRVPDGTLRRRARRHGGGAWPERYRRRHRLERGVPRMRSRAAP